MAPAEESSALARQFGSEEVVVGTIRFGGGYAVESVEAGGKETGEAGDADGEANGLHYEGARSGVFGRGIVFIVVLR